MVYAQVVYMQTPTPVCLIYPTATKRPGSARL